MMLHLKNTIEMPNLKIRYGGSIALPTVVLVASILLIGGLSLVAVSIDVRKASKGYAHFTQASLEAEVCLEETLELVKFDPDYTGSFNMTFPTGECDSVVSNIGGDTTLKEVVITSDYGESEYEKKYQVDVSDYPLTISEL